MSNQTKYKLSFKIWLEHRGKPLIGKGGAQILEQIEKERSISRAAKNLGMSYRYVWSYIKKVERTLGSPIVKTYKGGRRGGGGAKLTNFGKELLEEYRRVECLLNKALAETK
ncbi:MAG: LysR family transcriptional regulator [Candidatus Bathyarchaeota archaeon]|nr:LysR family transcriptional regulator [Candidatus Bathyarchaeota archaeon]MDW8040285.1 LysR family transcriptional regulator [Nitrososphaerota archaeon]